MRLLIAASAGFLAIIRLSVNALSLLRPPQAPVIANKYDRQWRLMDMPRRSVTPWFITARRQSNTVIGV